MNMTKCYLGSGLPEYFLYKGVTSGEEVTYTIYICRARVGATKTLSLAVMEIKLNIFLNDTQFRHSNRPISSQGVERVYA